jgi:hypothetical protein
MIAQMGLHPNLSNQLEIQRLSTNGGLHCLVLQQMSTSNRRVEEYWQHMQAEYFLNSVHENFSKLLLGLELICQIEPIKECCLLLFCYPPGDPFSDETCLLNKNTGNQFGRF